MRTYLATTLRRAVPAALAGVLAVSCATNPVTGKSELALVSESQEIQMGQQSAEQVRQTIGLYDDAQLQAYVNSIGMKMAKNSERPDLPWSFQVVNDPGVNAFALPGGPIFVTRGLITAINNEAELATVVGHEIGHVTHRHAVEQISQQQVAQLGLGLGSILSPTVAKLGNVASAGLSLLFLKYSRDDESEADRLGFKYAQQNGWDVRQMTGMFEILQRMSQAQGGSGLPEWLSTHPDPGNRIQATQARLDTLHKSLANATVNRDGYLQRINKVVYGQDPREGYFQNNVFYHPDLRFQITMPQGWQFQNQSQAVTAVSPNNDAAIELSLSQASSPSQAAQQFLGQQGVQPGQSSQNSINGQSAVTTTFNAQDSQGTPLQGVAAFIGYGGKVFQILGYTAADRISSYQGAFSGAIGSFGPLTNQSALNVQPKHVELVKLPRSMTFAQFVQSYPSTIPNDELAIINEATDQTTFQAGQLVKRVR